MSELSEKTFGGGTPKTSNDSFWKGNIPWIQSSDLVEGSLFDVEPRKYISQEAVDKSATKLVPEKSVAIVTRVGVGKLAFMPFSYATSQDFLSLNVLKTEPQFTVYALYKKLQSELNAVQGTSIKGVTKDELLAKEVMIPCYKEQEKIGSYLHSLDHLITLHQRKLFLNFAKRNDWEQRKLGEILIGLQNNTLSRADLSNETGVAKNVHYGDVLIKFGEVLDVSKEKLPMISDESILSKYKSSFLQNGDVIVADTAEDSTVGKCSEIAGLNDEIVLSGLHTIPYRPIEKFASGYLGYYLNSSAYHNQLIPLMQGIKVTSISKSAMQDTDIVYPKSVEEQGKIGDYFQSLDNLITLHRRAYYNKKGGLTNVHNDNQQHYAIL